ncbi:ribonuclease H-like domain-containing protein [Patescibacteria group bacterium]
MKLVLDIETQNSFQEVGGKSNLSALKISLVGLYNYADNSYQTFLENELDKLKELLNQAELVIGYNLLGFDYPILQNYLKEINFSGIKTLDIFEKVNNYLGYRIKLESVAQGSLGLGKSGTGLDAIKYWQTGDIENLKKYCLQDVKITKDVYEYGVKNQEVKFKSLWGVYSVPTEWY